MEKAKLKKIGNILLNVLLYLFLALCIFTVILTVFSKKDADGAAEIFGYQLRIVTSDSMAACEHTDVSGFEIKSIPVRSMVFVQVMPDDAAKADEWYRSLKVGDVLTFRYVITTQVTITHRIASIEERENGFIIRLAGDNKSSKDGQLYQEIDTSIPNNTDYVIGKVTGQAYLLGVLMSFLMSQLGIVLIIIVPCVLIILLEAYKIVKVLSAEKKEREQAEKSETENELAALRRKLAELEKEKSTSAAASEKNEEEQTE
jgi:flagellar basal body-associated protein FliL